MTSILFALIIQPIEIIFEIIFNVMYHLIGNQGYAVFSVSIAMSLLTLPLYYQADKMQQAESLKQKSLSKWVDHIKKTFKGDERFMLLQEYYRQNNYSPMNALSGSMSLLLEIPFFIAGYHFLSHLEALHGAQFYNIKDLSMPDRLLTLSTGIAINVLPILMTLINCISGAIYTKGFPIKDKIQLYGMALIFLALLYNSPSGLVIYWTCNNLFSLIKNIFYKLKKPRLVANILCAIGGIVLYYIFNVKTNIAGTHKRYLVCLCVCSVCFIPLLLSLVSALIKKLPSKEKPTVPKKETKHLIFILGTITLALITGLLIPMSVIAASPAEFIDLHNVRNPIYLAFYTLCIAAGYFILWFSVFYTISSTKGKNLLTKGVYVLAVLFLINYMFFAKGLGTLSPYLVYDQYPYRSASLIIINLIVNIAVACLMLFAFSIKRFQKIVPLIYTILIIAIAGVSVSHIIKTNKVIATLDYLKENSAEKQDGEIKPIIPLSKTKQNVIVFMLDRAISGYLPYLFEEKPILNEQFAGFTYYPNTISHGGTTNYGTPGLFGGYEYVPTEMNKRTEEKLSDKQNEALSVLPVLFLQNGFNVTVCDAPYANYQWIPDLSIYKKWPEIKTHITMGTYSASLTGKTIDDDRRNFIFYSFFRVCPLLIEPLLYDSGNYYSNTRPENEMFARSYSVLMNLSKLSFITTDDKPTFLMIDNDTTHEPAECQLPDYEYSNNVHNEGFHTIAEGRIKMDGKYEVIHYHANMAAMLLMGKWFDWMRENGVYDNTRIIIVADHGRELGQFDYMKMPEIGIDVEGYNPLFLFKDFNATEFKTDNSFMTNADTPSLAVKDIIANPINPFTNKELDNKDKFTKEQAITSSSNWDILSNNGNTFNTSDGHWYSVHDNIFDKANWKRLD